MADNPEGERNLESLMEEIRQSKEEMRKVREELSTLKSERSGETSGGVPGGGKGGSNGSDNLVKVIKHGVSPNGHHYNVPQWRHSPHMFASKKSVTFAPRRQNRQFRPLDRYLTDLTDTTAQTNNTIVLTTVPSCPILVQLVYGHINTCTTN